MRYYPLDYTEGEGAIMERATDLSGRYWSMKENDLRKLKSRKLGRIQRLEAKRMSYLELQEIRALRGHLRWINAVLAAREAQEILL